MKIVKVLVKEIDCYKNNTFEIDLLAEKKVYQKDIETNNVKNLVNSIYKLNTISLVGINASGKTTTLKILADVINLFLENNSLDYEDIHLSNYFRETILLETYIYDEKNKKLYKLISKIEKNDAKHRLVFKDEQLYIKKILNNTTRKNFFDFDKINSSIVRSEIKSDFLKVEDSIFSSVLNKDSANNIPMLYDMSHKTNFNFLYVHEHLNLPMSFVNYLDPSIESFQVIKNSTDGKDSLSKYEIKFKGDERIIKTDVLTLEKYLSSGTIKGINILIQVMLSLRSGGYLLIDEIENHLNKTIVINLINLFNNPLNVNGATLIFTTHYSEILDNIERNDSIYVLNKKDTISLEKYSLKSKDLKLDRLDRKKSDVILSGAVNSAPSFIGYQKLLKDLKSILAED